MLNMKSQNVDSRSSSGEWKKFSNRVRAGMMGSGKSTIGKLLAERLNYRFFDR
jgi:adenylylsulfate kinase-like enzyme